MNHAVVDNVVVTDAPFINAPAQWDFFILAALRAGFSRKRMALATRLPESRINSRITLMCRKHNVRSVRDLRAKLWQPN